MIQHRWRLTWPSDADDIEIQMDFRAAGYDRAGAWWECDRCEFGFPCNSKDGSADEDLERHMKRSKVFHRNCDDCIVSRVMTS